MSFEQFLQKTWGENILYSVVVELTYRCNLNCCFCYNDTRAQGQPLSCEQYLQLLDDLRELQVLNLILTGGEPLAHPDLLTLGRKARQLGFVIRIKSNGHALRGKLAQLIKEEVDPFMIDLSLHGACAATHDRQTRVPGSFDRLMQNLPELSNLGLRIKLNCTLSRWNENEIEGMLAIAAKHNLRIGINHVITPKDDGDQGPLSITASREGKLRLFSLLDQRAQPPAGATGGAELAGQAETGMLRAAPDKHCGAGSSSVTIDPYGNVLPCVQWRRPVGNLHHQSIQDIWARSTGLTQIRDLTGQVQRKVEGQGPDGRLMHFCPGLAELTSGNPLAIYASARDTMELLTTRQERESQAPQVPIAPGS